MFTMKVYHVMRKIYIKSVKNEQFSMKTKPFNITFIILNGFSIDYDRNI